MSLQESAAGEGQRGRRQLGLRKTLHRHAGRAWTKRPKATYPTEESMMLENILHELRMAFVNMQKLSC